MAARGLLDGQRPTVEPVGVGGVDGPARQERLGGEAARHAVRIQQLLADGERLGEQGAGVFRPVGVGEQPGLREPCA